MGVSPIKHGQDARALLDNGRFCKSLLWQDMNAYSEMDQPLHPTRGLMATHDAHGRPFDLTDLKKWLRLHAVVFHTEKIDVRPAGEGVRLLPALLDFARQNGVRLSLRTDGTHDPVMLPALAEAGLLDVFCAMPACDGGLIARWAAACADAGLALRVQIGAPLPEQENIEAAVKRLAGAAVVNITLHDPFAPAPPLRGETASAALRNMNALARALDARGVEVNLLHAPFCLIAEENRPHVVNSAQFFLDHQHYDRRAYDFAVNIHARGPRRLGKAVENMLSRGMAVDSPFHHSVLPWLLHHPLLLMRLWVLHQLTRHLQLLRGPRPLPETVEEWEAAIEAHRRRHRRNLGPVCAACRFQRICDHAPEEFRRRYPDLQIAAVPGEEVISPFHLMRGRKRYYDAVDAARRELPKIQEALAEEARRITLREAPTREITADHYEIENHYTHHMPGAVRWLSFLNVEHCSTPLARLTPPFTMQLTFGGGIAGHIGFSFGRHAKILCPMVDYSHRLTLHVDEFGRYVLLRDGVLVRPTEFEGARCLPPRIGDNVEPRICIHNIDGFLLTQTLLLWEGRRDADGALAEHVPEMTRIKYSVVIICTRYTRRLQATLLGLAHQRGFDMRALEVVIGYVPGIDATDDLIDSMRRACPELRIVRMPFSEDHVRAKGFMINESRRIAAGDWIVLLDADIILPPDFFVRMETLGEDARFVAPDGRKMLTPDDTARVLLGRIRPWECFEELAAGAGEYRFREADRVPIGFCQCVRRDILEKIPYHERDHFEASDWWFGHCVIKEYGPETRLEGVVVLHLDHGGSQWYGAFKHM